MRGYQCLLEYAHNHRLVRLGGVSLCVWVYVGACPTTTDWFGLVRLGGDLGSWNIPRSHGLARLGRDLGSWNTPQPWFGSTGKRSWILEYTPQPWIGSTGKRSWILEYTPQPWIGSTGKSFATRWRVSTEIHLTNTGWFGLVRLERVCCSFAEVLRRSFVVSAGVSESAQVCSAAQRAIDWFCSFPFAVLQVC